MPTSLPGPEVTCSSARAFYRLGRQHYERRLERLLDTPAASGSELFVLFMSTRGQETTSEWLRCLHLSSPDPLARSYALTYRFFGLMSWFGEVAPFPGMNRLLSEAARLPERARQPELNSRLDEFWRGWYYCSGLLDPGQEKADWQRLDALLLEIWELLKVDHYLDPGSDVHHTVADWGKEGAEWLYGVKGALLAYRNRVRHHLGHPVPHAEYAAEIDALTRVPAWNWWPSYGFIEWAQYAWYRGEYGLALSKVVAAYEARCADHPQVDAPIMETLGLILISIGQPQRGAEAINLGLYTRWASMYFNPHVIATDFGVTSYHWQLKHLWALLDERFAVREGYLPFRQQARFEPGAQVQVMTDTLWTFWKPLLHPNTTDAAYPFVAGHLHDAAEPINAAEGFLYPRVPREGERNLFHAESVALRWNPDATADRVYVPDKDRHAFIANQEAPVAAAIEALISEAAMLHRKLAD